MQRKSDGQLGRPSRTRGEVDRHGSASWYKAMPKSRAVRRESEWGIVPLMAETTELSRREGSTLR